MDSPSGTPSAKKKPLSGQFDHNGDDDKLVTSNVAFGPQPKPSSAKSSESDKVNGYTACACYIIGLINRYGSI